MAYSIHLLNFLPARFDLAIHQSLTSPNIPAIQWMTCIPVDSFDQRYGNNKLMNKLSTNILELQNIYC